MLRQKLILLRSVPHDDIQLRELLERLELIERFTPYVQGGRGSIRTEEARAWLQERRNEVLAELTLLISTVAMVAAVLAMIAAIVAAVRR
jgi:hypothetical protein